MQTEFLLLSTALAAMAAVLVILTMVMAGQARRGHSQRLLAEQLLAGMRSESETTRTVLEAVARDSADRLATVRAAFDTGIEQMRGLLTREQGALRLALADAQREGGEQLRRQFETTRAMLEAKLREMREGNEARLAEIQKTVNEQLQAAVEKQMAESFNRVIDQFTAVQKAMGDVQAVTAQIGDIKRLFSNVKTRGGWGETQVRAMLDDILPPGSYQTNRRIRPDSDDVVEFAVIMPMRGDTRPVLPIDAKFPVEDYERLLAASEAGDADGERQAVRGLDRRIRDEARKIAAKYIFPPVTVEFAVLYLPTDALYAEVARIPGLIDDIGRACRVLVMGPSLLPALLRTVHLGFVTLALEQNADHIRDLLGATRTEMLKMDQVLDRLARQAGTMSTTIETARRRTRAVGRTLRGVEAIEAGEADRLLELDADSSETDAKIEDGI
ncbi:MAG: DNA recombination protein RmuC [Acetobacteraceae bacterium]